MCETCSQCPIPISREEFANAEQTPTCPECGRTVPADEAWEVYEPREAYPWEKYTPAPEVLAALAALDA